jgi:hypothetical protein
MMEDFVDANQHKEANEQTAKGSCSPQSIPSHSSSVESFLDSNDCQEDQVLLQELSPRIGPGKRRKK